MPYLPQVIHGDPKKNAEICGKQKKTSTEFVGVNHEISTWSFFLNEFSENLAISDQKWSKVGFVYPLTTKTK